MPTSGFQVDLRSSAETFLKTSVPPLELTSISTVSPSLAEVLRLCALRAGLSRVEGAGPFVLGNPKAWLGSAYHEVLASAGVHSSTNAGSAHETAWARAISCQYERARLHPLDRRFGTPERWPGYHLVRAIALLRAREIASTLRSPGPSGILQGTRSSREQWLSGAGGRLVGRPDLLRDNVVIDYKTGDVHEHEDSKVAKASYVRQLQIYAFLVSESTGTWPTRGVLVPMEGLPLEIELEPAACERIAEDALELMDCYNRQVRVEGAATGLASPSPEACRWCPYQMLCPAFWEAADDSWTQLLGMVAAGGPALAPPRPIHSGVAVALSMSSEAGTTPRGAVELAPLSPDIHPVLGQIHAGTRISVTGLARRADGSVVPTVRTVIALSEDLPGIVVSGTTKSAEAGKYAG